MLRGETPTAEEARAFEVAMILHAEHEMNASTFTARVVAGTNADMHSAIVAAISALKGALHGGANQAAMTMFEEFGSPAGVPEGVRARLEAKKPLYGFGHPLYYDNVIQSLRGEAQPDTDGREGLHSLEILIATYLSARDGRRVALPLED